MEVPQLQKYQLVESFLQSIRHAQSKQQFLTKVHEFDNRFLEDHTAPALSQKQKSIEKLPPMPQEKPRNPFKSNMDDNLRYQNAMQNTQQFPQQSPFMQQQPVRGNYSKTDQNFYRGQQQQGPNMRTDRQPDYNYMDPRNPQNQNPQMQQYGGAIGACLYNAFSQKQYDELKQQFFRPPMPRPVEPYNRFSEDTNFNFRQMVGSLGMNSSSDLMAGQPPFNRPSSRQYPERVNPFMKQ